jgi:hypothetical protein
MPYLITSWALLHETPMKEVSRFSHMGEKILSWTLKSKFTFKYISQVQMTMFYFNMILTGPGVSGMLEYFWVTNRLCGLQNIHLKMFGNNILLLEAWCGSEGKQLVATWDWNLPFVFPIHFKLTAWLYVKEWYNLHPPPSKCFLGKGGGGGGAKQLICESM